MWKMDAQEIAAFIAQVQFDERGLVPCIAQDADSREVLMLAYMNRESLEMTLAGGYCTYYSRSRRTLWKKGETSGHTQELVSIHYDCDGDTLLALVHQNGAACHTGHDTCFFAPDVPDMQPCRILEHDYAVVADRRIHPEPDSYTNYLFDKGVDKICKKVGEESAEIIIAAKNDTPHELACEISDFLYHVTVLMCDRGVTWDDVYAELIRRIGMQSPKVKKFRAQEAKERTEEKTGEN